MFFGHSALDDTNDLTTRMPVSFTLPSLTRLAVGWLPAKAWSGNPRPGPASTSMSRRLLPLVMVIAIPLTLVWTGSHWMQYRTERARAEAQLVEQARAVARLVDREFEEALAVARTLAGSSTLQLGDLAAFGRELVLARNML